MKRFIHKVLEHRDVEREMKRDESSLKDFTGLDWEAIIFNRGRLQGGGSWVAGYRVILTPSSADQAVNILNEAFGFASEDKTETPHYERMSESKVPFLAYHSSTESEAVISKEWMGRRVLEDVPVAKTTIGKEKLKGLRKESLRTIIGRKSTTEGRVGV